MNNRLKKSLAVALVVSSLSSPVWAVQTANTSAVANPTAVTQVQSSNTMEVAHNPLKATIPSLQVAGSYSKGLYYTNGGHITFTDYSSLYNAMQSLINEERNYDFSKDNLTQEKMDRTQLTNAFKSYDEIMTLYKQNNIKLPEGCVPSPIWRNQCSIMFNANTTAARADWSFIPENVRDAYLKDIDKKVYGSTHYSQRVDSEGKKAQNAFMDKYYNPNDPSRYDNIEVMEVTVDSYKDLPKDVYIIEKNGLFRGVGDITFRYQDGITLANGRKTKGGLLISSNSFGCLIGTSSGYTSADIYEGGIFDSTGSKSDKLFRDVFTFDNVNHVVFTTFSETITQTTDINGSPATQVLMMPKIIIFHIGK